MSVNLTKVSYMHMCVGGPNFSITVMTWASCLPVKVGVSRVLCGLVSSTDTTYLMMFVMPRVYLIACLTQ